MSFETELVNFVKTRPAFYNPIVAAIGGSPSPSSTAVVSRLCYGQAPANVGRTPYVVWTGPFDYDPGNFSGGSLSQKKAQFWFSVYTAYLDDAIDWISAIEEDLVGLFVPGYFYNLTTCRITQIIQNAGTKMHIPSNQSSRTGEEFPTCGATIAFTIGWQNGTP